MTRLPGLGFCFLCGTDPAMPPLRRLTARYMLLWRPPVPKYPPPAPKEYKEGSAGVGAGAYIAIAVGVLVLGEFAACIA